MIMKNAFMLSFCLLVACSFCLLVACNMQCEPSRLAEPVPEPIPEPEPVPEPTPPSVPTIPPQIDTRPPLGSVTPSLFTDIEPVDGPPSRGGLTEDAPLTSPHLLGVGPFVVDDDGNVYTADGDMSEVILQPMGSWEKARVLYRTPDNSSGRREELLGITKDRRNLYLASVIRTADASSSVFCIRSLPKEGGTGRVIARGECVRGVVQKLFVDETHVYWIRTRQPESDNSSSEAAVQRVPKEGGSVETVVPNVGGFHAMALIGGSLVYARGNGRGEQIERVGTDGGEPELLYQANDLIGAIVGDERELWFVVRDPDSQMMHVFHLPTGGEAREVATFDSFPTALRRDGMSTYWADFTSDSLDAPMRVMTVSPGGEIHEVANGVRRGARWTIARGRVYLGTGRGVESIPLTIASMQ